MSNDELIDTTDLRRQIAVFERLRSASPVQKNRFIDRTLIRIDREVKAYARSGGAFSRRSTGMLARKSGWKNLGDGSGVITGGVGYAMIQEFGGQTKPHPIRLRNAKAFAFASGPGGFSNAAQIGSSKKFARIGSSRIGRGAAAGKMITGMTIVSGSKGTPGVINHPGSKIKPKHYTRDSYLKVRAAIIDDAERLVISMAGGTKWP